MSKGRAGRLAALDLPRNVRWQTDEFARFYHYQA